MRLNLAQRIVVVIALGFALLAVGDWVEAISRALPTGWTGYAPLQTVYEPGGLTPTESLLMWVGFAALWALASIVLLRSTRSSDGGHDHTNLPER